MRFKKKERKLHGREGEIVEERGEKREERRGSGEKREEKERKMQA